MMRGWVPNKSLIPTPKRGVKKGPILLKESAQVLRSVGKRFFSQTPIFLHTLQTLRFLKPITKITSTSDGYTLDSNSSHCLFATSVYGYRLPLDGEEKNILMSSEDKHIQHRVNNFLIHLSAGDTSKTAYLTALGRSDPEAMGKAMRYEINSFIFMTYLKGNGQEVCNAPG